MKNTVNLLSGAQESFHFCDLISKLFDQNQLIPIDIILSYLSTEQILSISFLTTSKLKHIMVENNTPFLASYLKRMYNSRKSENFLFKNQIDYFSILMDRIFDISSYFNMKHIFCKCNKQEITQKFVKTFEYEYEEFEFISDDDEVIFSEPSEKKKPKKKWDNSNCWVLKNLGFHSKTDIFVQETDLINERKSANLWKRSLKDEILAPIDQTEKNHINVYLAAFIILCISQTNNSVLNQANNFGMFDNLSKFIFYRMIGKRLFHKEFGIFSEGIFNAEILSKLTHEKEYIDYGQNIEENDSVNFDVNSEYSSTQPFKGTVKYRKAKQQHNIFTGYFGYSKNIPNLKSLGKMFKSVIIYRDQKKEIEIFEKWKKSVFRMVNSPDIIFDKNFNDTTILANEKYFNELISNLGSNHFWPTNTQWNERSGVKEYTTEMELLANFFIKKTGIYKTVLVEAVNERKYDRHFDEKMYTPEHVNWTNNLFYENFFVDTRTWAERCSEFWKYFEKNYGFSNRTRKRKIYKQNYFNGDSPPIQKEGYLLYD